MAQLHLGDRLIQTISTGEIHRAGFGFTERRVGCLPVLDLLALW